MKNLCFQHNSSCQSTARPADFFSCHTSNIVLTKDTMVIVSFFVMHYSRDVNGHY